MKRIMLFLLLIAASVQLKAQQTQLKPDVKPLNNGLINYFKPYGCPSPRALLLQPGNTLNKPAVISLANIAVYSTMPVAKTYNTDRMPVVVPGDPNIKYTMLVKKVDIVNPAAPAQDQRP